MTAEAPHAATGPTTGKSPSGPPASRPPAPPPAPLHRSLARALPVSPAVVLLLLFLAGPIAYCAFIAFTDLQLTGQAEESFVGFDNFRTAFGDEAFLNAV